MTLGFTGERIVPGASDCEPTFAQKMYQEHIARYSVAAGLCRDADVLDVGCGVGYGSQLLGKSGARSVLGIDLSAEAIEHARAYYFHPAVSYKVQAAAEFEPGQGYDLITCFELIEHIAEQQHVLDLIKAALRPAGILAISTPRPLDEIRTHFHVHEMSFEEIYGSLRARFKHVECLFEVNCLTSFIGAGLPERLEHVVPVTDAISLNEADYFVFLASDEPFEGARQPHPVLALNDDSYVLTLEKDVRVLRKAEEDHLAKVANLEREVANLRADADTAGALHGVLAAVHQMEERWRSSLPSEEERSQMRAFEAELERERTQSAQLRVQVSALQGALTEAEAQRQAASGRLLQSEEQIAANRSQLADASVQLERVRKVLAERSEQLAQAQTDAHNSRTAAEDLRTARERASALENELAATRYRLDAAETTLARFRRSFSWKLTRPLRWIWRNYRKMIGGSLP